MAIRTKNVVYVNGTPVKFQPSDLIGEGGEAEVYRISADAVLKLYKQPDHISFAGNTPQAVQAREGTHIRLQGLQAKLPAMPNMPGNVVTPKSLAMDGNQQLAGYVAEYIKNAFPLRALAQRDFREQSGITNEMVVDVFGALRQTIIQLHASGVVIGDFNPLNVLIAGTQPYLIDSDSMQFGSHQCLTYTPRYADPLITEIHNNVVQLVLPHDQMTDWYAFALMLWESLLYVHPYGGVYKPQPGSPRLTIDERPFHRLTVMHPQVTYPAAGNPISTLPGEVVAFYEDLLLKDKRGVFPEHLMQLLKGRPAVGAFGAGYGTRAAALGLGLGTPAVAGNAAAGLVAGVGVVLGSGVAGVVTSPATPLATTVSVSSATARCRRFFSTTGVILSVVLHGGKLRYIYHENGTFFREDGTQLMSGKLDPSMRFVICGKDTFVFRQSDGYRFSPGCLPLRFPVEMYRDKQPVLAGDDKGVFFVTGGDLWYQANERQQQHIDGVISKQTRIWSGDEFGFGISTAGGLHRAFLFDDKLSKIGVDLPLAGEQILDVNCYFADALWLVVTLRRAQNLVHKCFLIERSGRILGAAEMQDGEADWLGAATGKCAAQIPDTAGKVMSVLLCATGDGIVQVQNERGVLTKTRLFTGTAAFVNPREHFIFSEEGLVVWNTREINIVTTS